MRHQRNVGVGGAVRAQEAAPGMHGWTGDGQIPRYSKRAMRGRTWLHDTKDHEAIPTANNVRISEGLNDGWTSSDRMKQITDEEISGCLPLPGGV